jgi:competence protein ComEC
VSGWLLALAAAGFWAGILVVGVSGIAPTAATCAVLMAAGVVLVIGGLRTASTLGPGPAGRLAPAGVAVAAFAVMGAGWFGLHGAHLAASPLVRLNGRSVEVWGTLASDPEPGTLGWTASVQVGVIFPSTTGWPASIAVHDSVWAEGRGRPPPLRAGDRVALGGLLDQPPGSFGEYLRRRGYAGAFSVSQIHFRGPPTSPLLRSADAVRDALRTSLQRVFPAREAGLLMGLTLGDTSRLDPEVAEDFRATGLTHLLAVSGENVAMFLAPVLGLTVLLGAGRRTRLLVGLVAVVFFVMLTRAEPSVLRAAAMATLVMLGIFLGRPRSPPAIVGGAVLVLLGLNPTLVFAVGFQLSVAATVGMALLAGPIAERFAFLPAGLALAVGTTLAAQAGVTPVLLYYFGAVPTVTLLANVLAFPAVGPGMLLGLVAAAVGIGWGSLGSLIADLALIPLRYLEALANRLARAPLPTVTSGTGRALQLAASFAVVAAFGWWLRSGGRVPRRAAVVVAVILPLFLWTGAFAAGPPGALTVTFFDVGQGDAALIRSPAGAAILIDGGPDPSQVATKLAALGVHRLDLMVATHPHADHVGGLPAVLARVPVGLVIDPGCAGDSPFYADFLRAVRAAGVPFRHPRPGEVLTVGDVRVEVLGPEHCFSGTDSDPNNDSLVLRVVDGTASVMFPGDAERQNQTDLLNDEGPYLAATVLKVPHHGGDTSLDAFLAAIGARVAVVSVGPNTYGHPVPRVLHELAGDGMRVIRTDVAGDVTVVFDRGSLLVRSTRG